MVNEEKFRNYFESSIHDSDFLSCEFCQPTEVFEGNGNGFGIGSTCRLKLINHLFFDG